MLRWFVFGLGGICIAAGLVGLALGLVAPAWVFGCWGVVIVIGIVFERATYKRLEPAKPGPDWERTSERFIDDNSGQPVTVYYRPATGERAYVQE